MTAPKLKICGVKSAGEARLLRGSGVDLAGLNFIPNSSRFISLKQAEAILAELKPSKVQTVALFAGRSLDEINDYAGRLKIDYVQLHGGEPPDYARNINAPVIRAIAVHPGQSAADLVKFISQYPADYFVLDRHRQGQGEPIDTKLASQIIAAEPGKIFLAGGLTPDNLPVVLSKVYPYGIDIAGGVRTGSDDLDITKVNRCLKIVRA